MMPNFHVNSKRCCKLPPRDKPMCLVSMLSRVSLFQVCRAGSDHVSISKFHCLMKRSNWNVKNLTRSSYQKRRVPFSTSPKPTNQRWLRTSSNAKTRGWVIIWMILFSEEWTTIKAQRQPTGLIYRLLMSLELFVSQFSSDAINNFSFLLSLIKPYLFPPFWDKIELAKT